MNSFIKEPARLAAERQRLHHELVSASMEHYPVFIQCAQSSFQAMNDMQTSRTYTSQLCKDIDALEQGCNTFAEMGMLTAKPAPLQCAPCDEDCELLRPPQNTADQLHPFPQCPVTGHNLWENAVSLRSIPEANMH